MLQVDKKSPENIVFSSFLMPVFYISKEEQLDEFWRADCDFVWTNMHQESLRWCQ